MALLELPHSQGCLVCGRSNPLGMKLSFYVDESSGLVRCEFVPRPQHIGFEGILHGGALAAVLDEAMTWAATWHGRRFCFCGELCVRYRSPARPDRPLSVQANVDRSRQRMIFASARMLDPDGALVASASGKYVPVPLQQHRDFCATFLKESATAQALETLCAGGI